MPVLPFPISAPPARPVLQASIHARGARTFAFTGEVDVWHAPGALIKSGITRCAVDAAWLVEQVLGVPRTRPMIWPGVHGARERAIALGAQAGLYSFQQEGAAFLAERDYALLMDEMGLGKTGQALIAAEARLSMGHIPDPQQPLVLVLCPALAKRHWQREITKWTGHEAEVLESLTPSALPHTRYVIANYDILYGARRKDAAGVVHEVEHLPGWSGVLAGQFLIVISDEAHVFRGRSSRRTATVKKMTARVPVMWGLTGTPMPNYVRDLWSTLDLLSGGLLGTYWEFAKKYADASQAQYGWKDTGSSNLDELRGRLTFFALGRSTASVGMELPEKRREIFKIDVQVSAPTVHEGVQAMHKSGFVARALRITATAKRSAVVAQTVEALEVKQKVVVFCYMREQVDAIGKAVRAALDCTVMCVHGDLSPDGRDAQATTFRDCDSPAAFIATIDSVGVAISLVGADLVLFADLVPEPWKLLQAEKRCHRHGSTKRVLVRYLIGTGTLDEGVAETVIEKLASIEDALGSEADQQELSGMLGGGAKSEETIIEGLFARLKALGGSDE